MGRLVLDENQEPIYAMQLSGVHVGKIAKVGSAARRRLVQITHLRYGNVKTWGYARVGNGWQYSLSERSQPYDAVVTFYKEEETHAKH